jgi:hypothetical protein
MTVGELIKKLKTEDKGATVYFKCPAHDRPNNSTLTEVDDVEWCEAKESLRHNSLTLVRHDSDLDRDEDVIEVLVLVLT